MLLPQLHGDLSRLLQGYVRSLAAVCRLRCHLRDGLINLGSGRVSTFKGRHPGGQRLEVGALLLLLAPDLLDLLIHVFCTRSQRPRKRR